MSTHIFDGRRQLAAEALGTGILVCTVVGSGVMADKLTTDTAVALLGNTLPTGAILFVLITILGPVSGAHFNPAVTVAFAVRGELPRQMIVPYVVAQIGGGILGTIAAHAMFELDLLQFSATVRTGPAQWFAEVVATFGLVFTILAGVALRPRSVPMLVALYITAAYWFTSSTSFANPAVTIARGFSNTFAGIAPADVIAFIIVQLISAVIATRFFGWLLADDTTKN